MNPYNFTKLEAEEILAKKNIDSEWLISSYQTRSLKSIAKEISIGHVRLSSILRALGSSTDDSVRYSKMSYSYSDKRKAALESKIAEINENDLRNDARILYRNEIEKKYDIKGFYEEIFTRLNIEKVSPNTILAQRKYEDLFNVHKEEISKYLDHEFTFKSIAAQLNLSVDFVKRVARDLRPNYKAKLSQAFIESIDRQSESCRTKRLARVKELPLDQILHDINEELLTLSQSVNRRGISEWLIPDLVELLAVDISKDNARRWMNRGLNVELSKHAINQLSLLNIDVDEDFKNHNLLYRAYLVSKDPEVTKTFILNCGAINAAEIKQMIPWWDFSSLCDYFREYNLYQHLSKKPSIDERAVNRCASNLSSSVIDLKSIIETLDLKSTNHLSEIANISVNEAQRTIKSLKIKSRFRMSNYERLVSDYLNTLKIEFVHNTRSVLPSTKQLDFYIESKKIAIEVNPTYTHNSTTGWEQREELALDSDYHFKKIQEARSVDVKLIMLYEQDLTEPKWSNVTKPFIKFQLLGADRIFYGRDVSIVESSDKKAAKEFFDKYHEQGSTPAKFVYKFSTKEGATIGWASFGAPASPNLKKKSWIELKRLAFAPGVQIRFGISKLMAAFKKDHGNNFNAILSYSRNDMGDGSSYERAGFTFIGETGPNLRYVNPSNPYDSYSWMIATPWGAKSGVLSRHLGPQNLTKEQARLEVINNLPHRTDSRKGYVEVYGAGSRKWLLPL